MRATRKLYCYVDETGQDTRGALFIVSVVVSGQERDSVLALLEALELATGKGKVKWVRARDAHRIAYIRRILSTPVFKGRLYFAHCTDVSDYLIETASVTARVILGVAGHETKATVFVDGLPKSKVRAFGAILHRLGVRTRKVRGVRREESDALMRLADALCGFARAASSGRGEFALLLEEAKMAGYVKEV